MHVIVSYLKVICNLQAGSRDKHVFKGAVPAVNLRSHGSGKTRFFLENEVQNQNSGILKELTS